MMINIEQGYMKPVPDFQAVEEELCKNSMISIIEEMRPRIKPDSQVIIIELVNKFA